ncbi:hypothetical protein [Nannocystis punicea]|uniref:Uncharacterized protein n=1 Tax=Nannocystis punicea TaxID=2995304 RepID=A0ABY7H770_9BACT|nr:hypothetical protein [Nannocystis poenicansa]WAS95077.1 hypothetical protein O0S08_02855 [Nannocystis poenicansa]
MLESARRWLSELREGADAGRFAYHEVEDEADPGSRRDAAGEDRALLLLALQYDFQPAKDAALARFLLAAQIAAHSRAPFQGYEDELRLAAWLVARLGDPADVWQMNEAKHANFDTYCGMDRTFMLAAGVAATLAYVRDSEHRLRDDVLELLLAEDGTCLYTEAEVAEWRASMTAWFPAREEDEALETRIDRAIRFAPEEGPALLDAWLSGRELDDAALRELCHWASALDLHDRAEAAARTLLARASAAEELGARDRLVLTLVAAARHKEAEVEMLAAAALAAALGRTAWEWRMQLERWLELGESAWEADEVGVSARAFARADALSQQGHGHCFDNFERLAALAGHVGDEEARARLAALRDAEGQRISEQTRALEAAGSQ